MSLFLRPCAPHIRSVGLTGHADNGEKPISRRSRFARIRDMSTVRRAFGCEITITGGRPMPFDTHLSDPELHDLILGKLPDAIEGAAESHLAKCPACQV